MGFVAGFFCFKKKQSIIDIFDCLAYMRATSKRFTDAYEGPPPCGQPRGIPRGQLYPLPKEALTKLLGPAVDRAGTRGGTLYTNNSGCPSQSQHRHVYKRFASSVEVQGDP